MPQISMFSSDGDHASSIDPIGLIDHSQAISHDVDVSRKVFRHINNGVQFGSVRRLNFPRDALAKLNWLCLPTQIP
eukprot:2492725-Heterocapsa_arctica.AAC.1